MSDNSFQELDGPYKFVRDESSHWYLVPEDKVERFNDLLYGEADEFDWANDKYDVIGRFEEEFSHFRSGRPSNTKVWIEK